MILVFFFVALPLLELYLLAELGSGIGWPETIGICLFTGVVGAHLTRAQGLATLGRYQQSLAEGRLPAREIVEGLLILVAGAVLITPGLITDATGFVLLVPTSRRWIANQLGSRLGHRVEVGQHGPAAVEQDAGPDVIDVEFKVRDTPSE